MQYTRTLIPFNKKRCPEIQLDVDLKAEGPILKLQFEISNNVDSVLLPEMANDPKRVIGLWESTCFEIFIKNPLSDSYYEFNFSPEGHWNCFYFNNPKEKLKECTNVAFPVSAVTIAPEHYRFSIEINTESLKEGFWSSKEMEFGLTTIIEDEKNNLSFWAIEHHDEAPNFHNFSSFKLVSSENKYQ
jgi:hypothetical protein